LKRLNFQPWTLTGVVTGKFTEQICQRGEGELPCPHGILR
jgi:hypothetical protein